MRLAPWWALLSSGCAVVLLVGGWTIAAYLQGPGYDPTVQTISSLAGYSARDRWLMTNAMIAVGACHGITALGLRAAAPAGRLALVFGGVATILVALSPEQVSGPSFRHGAAAGVGAVVLAVWPWLATGRGPFTPWALRPAVSAVATALLLAAVAWFVVEVHAHSAAGLSERVVSTAETAWPLVVVASCVGRTSDAVRPLKSRSNSRPRS
ncbi:putative membrane protein [Streptacidiphilus sp. MAP12-16]|uniref:DUF998 domain-containing protein n=1 Tax=Streptacidiphilus sp. MAP12-16 TaxID=3156300 RepID=UPI003513B7AA